MKKLFYFSLGVTIGVIMINFALYIIESHSFMASFTQYYVFKIHPYICFSL